MDICIMCDTHLQTNEKSPQFSYLKKAINKIKKDCITRLIHLGDIVSYGQVDAFNKYLQLTNFIKDNHYVLGNAEIRDKNNVSYFLSKKQSQCISVNGKKIFLINTPYAKISDDDAKILLNCEDGDIIMAHHSLTAIKGKNKEFFENLLKYKKLTFIHAHSHCKFDYKFGKSRVIGLRALDPDKSIGDYPCIYYLNIGEEITIKEVLFKTDIDTLKEIKNYFGFSCLGNRIDLLDAINYGVKNIEIKLIKSDYTCSEDFIILVNDWKTVTNGYLSIHMPNIIYENKSIKYLENFKWATNILNRLKVNGVTLHPPKVTKGVLFGDKNVYQELLNVYVEFVNSIDNSINVGVENVHLKKTEIGLTDNEIGFGYTPLEVETWVNSINKQLGSSRVKYVLDVGHIQNNKMYTSIYPTSSWYTYLAKNITAYHIHQVLKTESGLKNHNPITSWFGPLISYASFFYSFENDVISKAPIFLEIKNLGIDGYLQSLSAFDKLLD